MQKTAYVKVPISTKIKKDTPLFVIEHQALSNFLKVNNLNPKGIISTATDYEPQTRRYSIAIRFYI